MKKKLLTLSVCCLVLAVVTFVISYVLYHYMLPGGVFTTVWQPTPGKPFVTGMVADLGVLFLFSGILSLLIRGIFFREEK